VPHTPGSLPDFVNWPSFPFEGEFRVKKLQDPVAVEPPRKGEDANECIACNAPDEAYIWVSDRWRVRAMDRPTGLPMVLILESRSHLDLGDLPNLLAAELGVMTVRLERAIRSLDGVARVHVNRWGDGSAHLHMWFLARPVGRLQLRGTFLSLWDDILPPISEHQWRENLALVAAWLAEFGGRPLAEPPRIEWKAPSRLDQLSATEAEEADGPAEPAAHPAKESGHTAGPVEGGASLPSAAEDDEGDLDDPADVTSGHPAPGNGDTNGATTGSGDTTRETRAAADAPARPEAGSSPPSSPVRTGSGATPQPA
jgi:hypothetical protein